MSERTSEREREGVTERNGGEQEKNKKRKED